MCGFLLHCVLMTFSGRTKCPSTQCQGQRAQGPKRLLANGQEPTEDEPWIVKPVESQVPQRPETAEVRHVARIKVTDPGRAKRNHGKLPLHVRIRRTERQQFSQRSGTESVYFEMRQHLINARHPVQVNELNLHLDRPLSVDREVVSRDVLVDPVVLPRRDHLCKSLAVVDGDGVLGRLGELQGSHHQHPEITTVTRIREEAPEVTERTALLFDGFDHLLQSPRQSTEPRNRTFLCACHKAPLSICAAYIVPTLCRRNAYHDMTGRNSSLLLQYFRASTSKENKSTISTDNIL